VKAPGKRVTGKAGEVTTLEVDSFKRAAINTTGVNTVRVFVLEPGDDENRIEWGKLGVEGRFKVVETIERTNEAVAAWKAFRAS
jgi:leucyl-tRNA synthetase